MPPGIYHAVFTATNSLASGGHFYSLHAMVQTAISRRIDVTLGDVTTNTAHPSVELLLHLMAQNLYASTRGTVASGLGFAAPQMDADLLR